MAEAREKLNVFENFLSKTTSYMSARMTPYPTSYNNPDGLTNPQKNFLDPLLAQAKCNISMVNSRVHRGHFPVWYGR